MNPFSLPFIQTALAASLLAGNALALIGAFVLMRRVSFSGLAVSQLAALGAVAGVFLGAHHVAGFAAALACAALGMASLAYLGRSRRTPEESWVACLYVLGAALAVLILAKDPQGETHTMSLFFGNVLALGPEEVAEAGALLGATLLILGCWLKRWIWLFFDPLSAQVSGLAAGRWHLLFLFLFAASMTVAIHLFGVLLAFAYLLLPAMTALLLCASLRGLLLGLPLACSLPILLGVYLSFHWDFPTGPFIAGLMALQALAAGVLRSARG